MADWSVIETALEGWVTSITGLTVIWRRRPRAHVFTDTGYALLDIVAKQTLGRDQLTYDYDVTAPLAEEITYSQSGQRTFALAAQMRISRTAVDVDAKHYTSLMRDSVQLPQKSTLVFDGADIAFSTILLDIELPDKMDGRQMSVAQLDIGFNASASTTDTPIGYIATVKDAELEIPEGTTVWTGDIPIE